MRRSFVMLAVMSLLAGLLFVVSSPAGAQEVEALVPQNQIEKSRAPGSPNPGSHDTQTIAPGGQADFRIQTGRLSKSTVPLLDRQYRVVDVPTTECNSGVISAPPSGGSPTVAGFDYTCSETNRTTSYINTAKLERRDERIRFCDGPGGRPFPCGIEWGPWQEIHRDTSEVIVRDPEARITVVKEALPEDDSPFGFLITTPAQDPPVASFTLMDPSDNTETTVVNPGPNGTRYRVVENSLPAGRWFFHEGVCRDESGRRDPVRIRPTDFGARSDELRVLPGEHWICTFHNKEYAQIQFGKIALTEHPLTDPDATFEFFFFVDGVEEFHSLQDGDTVLYDRVRAGGIEIAIEYLLPPRWRVKDIYCEDGAGDWEAFIDPSVGILLIDPDWGDEYVCWFVDEEIFLSVEKLVNGHDADTMPGPTFPVGEPLTYKFVVTNHGPTTAIDIAVNDNKLGPIACPKTVLEPGESMTCTVESVVMPGEHKNVATVTGWSDGEALYDADPAHYVGEQGDFDLKIVKRGPRAAATGQVVTYEYFVWNQMPGSSVPPTVIDDKCDPVEYHSGDWNDDGLVQFGEAWKFTCDYEVTEPPFTMIVNTATVHPTDGDFNPDDNTAWWWMPVVPWLSGAFGLNFW